MRFSLVLAAGLFLLACLTPQGDCAPIRQDATSQGESASSQESPTSSGPSSTESSQTTLRTSPTLSFRGISFPLVFKDGQMILPYYNFEQLEKILFRGDRKTNPAYSLQKIEAVGQVEGQTARIRFELTLATSDDPLVSVPIGLKEGVCLEADPHHQLEHVGEGSCELTVDSQTGNYLLLLHNRTAEHLQQANSSPRESQREMSHQVALTLSFPVESIGQEEQRMKISAPQAVSSRLVLSVPIPDAVATDTQGVAILRPSKPLPEGGTQFELLGFSKLLDLSWHRQTQSTVQEKQVTVQVENAQIHVHMTPREVVFDATLPVRAVGGSLQHFEVRLPSHTRYLPEPADTPDYQIRVVTPEGSETNSQKLEVLVTGSPKQDTLLQVHIRAGRSFSAEEQFSWRELGGFEVLHAPRQYGNLEIHVSNDLKPNWRNQHGIREDESFEPDSANQEERRIRFMYYSQPFSLEARVTLPQTRISVKPEYQVLLEKGQILLTGKIQTTISGSKTNQLQWNFYDWQLEGFDPNFLVDSYGVIHEEGVENRKNGTTTIPLRNRSDGPVELTFTARRPMPTVHENQTTVEFLFPAPIADRIEPATIAIIAADNIELSNANQKIVGMSRGNRNTPLNIPSPSRQQPPLIFRSDMSVPTMSFRSDVIFHKQEVHAHSKTVVRILEAKDQIEQTIRYNVKYEPLEQITLLIPRWVDESGSLKLYFDDKSIPETGRSSFPDMITGTGLVRRRITLPTPLIGSGTVLLRYSMSQMTIQREMTMRIAVPQILPTDAEIVEQTVVASAPGGVNILPADGSVSFGFGQMIPSNLSSANPPQSGGVPQQKDEEEENPWRRLEKSGDAALLQETVFATTSWEPAISLSVQLDHRDIFGTTVVDRAWIQTLLYDRIRVDQAAFRIRSDHEKILLFLPVGFDRSRVKVTWDNTLVPIQYDEGAIVIVQPKEQRSQSHLLVVKYQTPNETISSFARVRINLPYFNNDVWVRRTYWQVILPQKQHLFGDLPGWTPEFHWNWTGLCWNRDASLSQNELELWIGASEKQDLIESPEIACYLFSSFNPRRQCELLIVERKQLVLFSSGIILLVGLALVYFPRLRQIGVMFALTVLLVSIYLYQPTPALLVFQASILGVALSLVSAFLARILYRESDWKYAQPFLSPSVAAPGESSSSSTPVPQEVLTDTTLHHSSIHETEGNA